MSECREYLLPARIGQSNKRPFAALEEGLYPFESQPVIFPGECLRSRSPIPLRKNRNPLRGPHLIILLKIRNPFRFNSLRGRELSYSVLQ